MQTCASFLEKVLFIIDVNNTHVLVRTVVILALNLHMKMLEFFKKRSLSS
jgi:hypothetical protein